MVNGTKTVNGTINGIGAANGHTVKEGPITKIFANIVSGLKFEALSPSIEEKFKELLLDYIGVTSATARCSEPREPFYNAIEAQGGVTVGSHVVLTKGQIFTRQYAALLNGAYGHSFDFDDTYAASALHPGVSIIPAALAVAESSHTNTSTLLTALAAGYEVTCRFGRALGTPAYDRGFHNTVNCRNLRRRGRNRESQESKPCNRRNCIRPRWLQRRGLNAVPRKRILE